MYYLLKHPFFLITQTLPTKRTNKIKIARFGNSLFYFKINFLLEINFTSKQIFIQYRHTFLGLEIILLKDLKAIQINSASSRIPSLSSPIPYP